MKFDDLKTINNKEKTTSLSNINKNFYEDLRKYIKELEEVERKISIKRSIEAKMIQDELNGAMNLIEGIFYNRIAKIIKKAQERAFSTINKTTMAHDIEKMTPEERQVYQQVLDAILSGKKNTIELIFGTSTENEPVIEPGIIPEEKTAIEPVIKTDSGPDIGSGIKTDTKQDIEPGIRPEDKTAIEPDIKTDSKPFIKSGIEPDIISPVHDTDRHTVAAGKSVDEVSGQIPTNSRTISKVHDQGTIVEKQEVPETSAVDNTTAIKKPPFKETDTQFNTLPAHEEKMSRVSEENGKKDLNKEYIVVRLLKNIPKFIGADGRNYRLGAQDVAVLPKVNAKALIKRKVAVQIEST